MRAPDNASTATNTMRPSKEGRLRTLLVAFVVSAICAMLVSGATVLLRPIQAANRAAEEAAQISALVSAIPGMRTLLQDAGGELSRVVIDLETGRAAPDVTADNLDNVLADVSNWSAIHPHGEAVGLAQRPDYALVYLLRDGEDVQVVLLPLIGSGYNGPIEAVLALKGDMTTIAGLAITQQAETPGLGGRIEERAWLASFPGTQTHDAAGTMRFAVARGPSVSPYEVDGITGATRTSNAVTAMVRFWLGPYGYGPFLEAIQQGEF